MDVSGQNRDTNEAASANSDPSQTQLITSSENSRQLALTHWHASVPPHFMGLNFPRAPSQPQTSHSYMYPANVSIQNVFLMQPYPTGGYANSHQTGVMDRRIYSSFSGHPLALAGPPPIMGPQRFYGHQETLPPHSFPTSSQYTSSAYPNMVQSSSHPALSSNYNNSVNLPTISELPTPEILNCEKPIENTATPINNVHSEISQGSSTIESSSNADQWAFLETPNQRDAISKDPLLNEPSNSDMEILNSLLDEFLTDEEWKNSASHRILDSLLTSNNVASNGTGRNSPQDSVAIPANLTSATVPSNPQTQVNQTQRSFVSASLRNSPSPPAHHAVLPHTPLYNQQQSLATPSSANANRSTIARDVLRALRPPSIKRKRIDSEQNSPLSSLKRTKIEDIDNRAVSGTPLNGSVVPRVTSYETPAPSTSNTFLDSIHKRNPEANLTESNLISTSSPPVDGNRLKSVDNATGIQIGRLQDLDVSRSSFLVPDIVMESRSNNDQFLSSIPRGHGASNGLHDPSPHLPASPHSPNLSLDDKEEMNSIQTKSIPTYAHQAINKMTVNSSMDEADIPSQRPPAYDQANRVKSLSPAGSSQIPSEMSSTQRNPNNESSSLLSLGTVFQNQMPLFLPSESPSSTEENAFFTELPAEANSSTDEPSPFTSSIMSKRQRRSNLLPYVLVPRLRKVSIKPSQLVSPQLEGRGKRAVEPEYPEVEESRCRLTERHCLWRDCRAILDSAEKLIKHTKVVHGSVADKEFYRCRWAGCTRLGTYFTSEDLTQHLRGHVHSLITCPYKGCAYETDQGKKLVSHIATKHDNPKDVLKPLALPNPSFPHHVMQSSGTCPAYYSIPIPVTAGLISRERHHRLQSLIRAHIVGKPRSNKHSIGTRSTNVFSSLTNSDADYVFQPEEASRAFNSLKQMSPVINEIDVLEGNLLNSVVIMGMGPTPGDNAAVDGSFRNVDAHDGLGTGLGPNLPQTAREERDFLEVEALL